MFDTTNYLQAHYETAVELLGLEEHFSFRAKQAGLHSIVVGNYNSVMAKFPPVNEPGLSCAEVMARHLVRELRGLVFDSKGNVISRPFHKFKNLGEGDENMLDVLPWHETVVVADKLDGSMVHPLIIGDDIFWCTKAGVTDMSPDIESFVTVSPINYVGFALLMNEMGATPIFEYMSPKNRVVIDYGPETSMVLLAARNTASGEYINHSALIQFADFYDVPVVKTRELGDPSLMVEAVRNLEDEEGVIIQFEPSGYRVKLKALAYLNLHKTRECIERERFVAMMTLNEQIDDMLALVPIHIQPRLVNYASSFLEQYQRVSKEMYTTLYDAFLALPDELTHDTRRKFALESGLPKRLQSIGFRLIEDFYAADRHLDYEDFDHVLKSTTAQAADRTEKDFIQIKNELGIIVDWNIWDTVYET